MNRIDSWCSKLLAAGLLAAALGVVLPGWAAACYCSLTCGAQDTVAAININKGNSIIWMQNSNKDNCDSTCKDVITGSAQFSDKSVLCKNTKPGNQLCGGSLNIYYRVGVNEDWSRVLNANLKDVFCQAPPSSQSSRAAGVTSALAGGAGSSLVSKEGNKISDDALNCLLKNAAAINQAYADAAASGCKKEKVGSGYGYLCDGPSLKTCNAASQKVAAIVKQCKAGDCAALGFTCMETLK